MRRGAGQGGWAVPEFLRQFILCFVPIAVAVDAISLVPIFIGMTERFNESSRRQIIWRSIVTAAVVGIAFLIAGKGLLVLMGIRPEDFQIAGGLILFGLGLPDILGRPMIRREVAGLSMGVVPLGVPLIVGPGVLTACLLLGDRYGYKATISALLVNLALVAVGLLFAARILRLLGEAGTKALTKLTGLLLLSYGVMLVRDGIEKIIASAP